MQDRYRLDHHSENRSALRTLLFPHPDTNDNTPNAKLDAQTTGLVLVSNEPFPTLTTLYLTPRTLARTAQKINV